MKIYMETTDTYSGYNFKKIADLIIRLGLLFLLVMWCFDILKPFVLLLIWASVIAIALYPLHLMIMKLFKGKKTLSVVMITLVMLSIIIVPSSMVIYSLYDGINHIRELYISGKPLIPPPGPSTADWPTFTKPIIDFWQLASDNLQEAVVKYSEQVRGVVSWLVATLAGVGKGILMFNVSIIIAGVLLAYSRSTSAVAKKIFVKIAGERGE